MKLISVRQMRELDRKTIEEAEIPGEVLMERAGVGAAEYILEFLANFANGHVKRIVLLAGKGNNGGDAYVIARFLAENTALEITVYAVCPIEDLSGDAKLNADRLPENVFCEIRKKLTAADFRKGDIIIDGLLGTGIKGPLKAPYDNWITTVNAAELPVVALDIPSGLNGDDGSVATAAVTADLTITMGLPKKGFICGKGPCHCGRIKCVDIGIPDSYINETVSDLSMNFMIDIRPFIKRIPVNTHKNARGVITVIGGSKIYQGAPLLTAKSALRSGAGLVTVALPESAGIGNPADFSLICRQITDGGKGVFSKESLSQLEELINTSDTVIIGPGLTKDNAIIPVVRMLNKIQVPVIYDADALNLIAGNPEIFTRNGLKTIFTPHPGEMKRLLNGFKLTELIHSERTVQAGKLAEKMNAVIVLKGNQTVIASPDQKVSINSSGGPALATAGSGDVLAGIIGTFAAQEKEIYDAATCGVYLHGLTGELGPYGIRGLTADDLPDLIPEALMRISPLA